MAFCYDCGCEAQDRGEDAPTCRVHGALWLLRRNAPSVSAVIVSGDRVLLTQRARGPWKGAWETPGGYVEHGEHPEQAVRRELHEELAAQVRSTELLGIYLDEWVPGDWHQTTVYAVTLTDADLQADAAEVADFRWFAHDTLPDHIASNHRSRLDDWYNRQA